MHLGSTSSRRVFVRSFDKLDPTTWLDQAREGLQSFVLLRPATHQDQALVYQIESLVPVRGPWFIDVLCLVSCSIRYLGREFCRVDVGAVEFMADRCS